MSGAPDVLRISVAMNTLDEEANLPYALRSVAPWVDDIVVVDMGSTDGTVEIARRFGATVIEHPPLGFADPARAVAVDATRGDWILILDADEVVPPALARELRRIAAEGRRDVVYIPFRNFFVGAALRHTFVGLGNDRHARFFRRGSLRTSGRIHAYVRPEPAARTVTLPRRPELAMQHFGYLDLAHFAAKIDRYTTIEARQMYARGEHAGSVRALWSTIGEFLTHYVRFRGFLDGWRGLYYSLFMAHYYAAKWGKLRELHEVGGRDRVRAAYRAEAEAWLAGYGDAAAGTADPE